MRVISWTVAVGTMLAVGVQVGRADCSDGRRHGSLSPGGGIQAWKLR